MGDETLAMSVPLDSDGFLRHECPTCEREFKSRPTPADVEPAPVEDGGYYCPYCAVQAPTNAWFTKAQIETARATVFDEVLKPELEKLREAARGSSGDFLKIDVSTTDPEKPPALSEADDMRRVDCACHPAEPLKVLDDWEQPVHCLICGEDTA
jgi:hypothetical protein